MKRRLFAFVAGLLLTLTSCGGGISSSSSADIFGGNRSEDVFSSSSSSSSVPVFGESSSLASDVDPKIYAIYQLYLDNGGTFSFQEWLASVKGQPGLPGEDGKDGQEGQDGTSFLSGDGIPSDSLGNNGDTYLDISSWDVYRKVGGQWVYVASIRPGEESEYFVVHFYVDGEEYEYQQLPKGNWLKRPADPYKPGYRFQGWYTFGGEYWVFNGYTVTVSFELYARFAQTPSSSASSSEATSEPVEAYVSITNKDALTAEWRLEDEDRTVKLDLSPSCNILEALGEGTLTITSSDPSVVGVYGRVLKPLGQGNATITVTYFGVSDYVELTVLAMKGEQDYAAKTLTEIMAIEEGLVPSGSNFYYNLAFMTQVEVAVIGSKADGSNAADKYGNMWVVEPEAEDGATPVQVYGSGASFAALSYQTDLIAYKYVNQKNYLDNEDTAGIKVGDILDVVAIRADYKTTKEISFVIRAINGELIGNDTVTTDQVNAMEYSNNLAKQLVTVEGTITGWKDDAATDGTNYGSFYIQSEESETDPVYVYGASASTSWEKTADDGSVTEMKTIELLEDGSLTFNNPKDFLTNEATKDLKIGDKVSVMGFRCDYKGHIEFTGRIVTPVA